MIKKGLVCCECLGMMGVHREVGFGLKFPKKKGSDMNSSLGAEPMSDLVIQMLTLSPFNFRLLGLVWI